MDVLLHQLAEHACADAVGLGVLLGVDVQVKVDGIHHAGCRQDADFAGKQPVERDVPPILREQIGPQLARPQQQNAHAVLDRAVDPLPFPVAHRPGEAAELRLFLRRELVPEWESAG